MAIKLINHTAFSFPLQYPQGVPAPSPSGYPSGLAGAQRQWLLFWYGEPQLHRFRLEIKKTGRDSSIQTKRVFIEANGQRNKMKRITPANQSGPDITGDSENWIWDSPDHLVTRYSYRFGVETDSTSTPMILFPEDELFRAAVSLYGRVSWFVPYGHATTSGNGQLDFWEDRLIADVFVQNLSTNDAVWDLTVRGRNSWLFSANAMSSLPGPLNSGDIARFRVSFDFSSAPPNTVRESRLDLVVSKPGVSRALLRTRFVLYGESYIIGA